MDRTEVTFEAYQACVAEGTCPRARPNYQDFSRPTQPMVGASWFHADTYCRAIGKHLPTEAEWQKAAAGPEGAATPFELVEEVSCAEAIVKDASGRACGTPKKGKYSYTGRTYVVGSRPAGRYGLHDMVGNAEEWVADWFVADLEACGEACWKDDPKGPCEGASDCPGYDKKMVMGGSWYWPADHAHSWHRRPHYPANKPYHHFGFRCAATVEQARLLLPGTE